MYCIVLEITGNTIKRVVIIIASVVVFGTKLTTQGMIGSAIAILGICNTYTALVINNSKSTINNYFVNIILYNYVLLKITIYFLHKIPYLIHRRTTLLIGQRSLQIKSIGDILNKHPLSSNNGMQS